MQRKWLVPRISSSGGLGLTCPVPSSAVQICEAIAKKKRMLDVAWAEPTKHAREETLSRETEQNDGFKLGWRGRWWKHERRTDVCTDRASMKGLSLLGGWVDGCRGCTEYKGVTRTGVLSGFANGCHIRAMAHGDWVVSMVLIGMGTVSSPAKWALCRNSIPACKKDTEAAIVSSGTDIPGPWYKTW